MVVKRILITHISAHFKLTDRYSAVASVIYSFADLLRTNGYEIYFNDKRLEDWEQSQMFDSGLSTSIAKGTLHKYFPTRLREVVKDLLLFRANRSLEQKIEQIDKPDLILAWVTYGNSYPVTLGAKWKIPVVSIFDNPLVEEYAFLKGFKPFFSRKIDRQEKQMVAESQSVIVYSHEVKSHLEAKHKISNKFYYRAFTDFKRMPIFNNFEGDARTLNFVYVGSFFNWHRVESLLTAFERVNISNPKTKLFLVGDGPEFNHIKKMVNNVNVTLTGRMDGVDLEQFMKGMHVGIIPGALWFQAPVKFFQYSAAGLAVIAINTPTIRELTFNKECYLLFQDEKDLEAKMNSLANNPETIRQRGGEAKKHVDANFSPASYSEFFNELFSSLS